MWAGRVPNPPTDVVIHARQFPAYFGRLEAATGVHVENLVFYKGDTHVRSHLQMRTHCTAPLPHACPLCQAPRWTQVIGCGPTPYTPLVFAVLRPGHQAHCTPRRGHHQAPVPRPERVRPAPKRRPPKAARLRPERSHVRRSVARAALRPHESWGVGRVALRFHSEARVRPALSLP